MDRFEAYEKAVRKIRNRNKADAIRILALNIANMHEQYQILDNRYMMLYDILQECETFGYNEAQINYLKYIVKKLGIGGPISGKQEGE